MITKRFQNLIASLVLLFPLSAAAQETPKLEIFGGYSYLGLTEQPRTRLESTSLNGWNASVKLNVTRRIGLLADFSGNYGQRELTELTVGRRATTPIRQHTYLFGPEVRVLNRGRLVVNLRALVGVAHTNTLPPAIARLTFPSANNTFASSFGGSVDYRLTYRLSLRVIQPEMLVTRSGSTATGSFNQYNFRLSSGIVFTSSGQPSHPPSSDRKFSFGVIGGAALTDAFGHERTGAFIEPEGSIQPTRSRSYSTLKDYAIGPMVEVGLPWHGLSVEIDALYRPMNLTTADVGADGSLTSISPATVVTWELSLLAKYRLGSGSVKPFIETGPSFRVSGNLNNALPSAYGGAAGLGLETHLGKLRISPVVRYIHWAADPGYAGSPTKRNQVELLAGFSF